MLTRRAANPIRFTRGDVPRIVIATVILVAALTAILGSDIIPQQPLIATVGQLASRDIVAPRAIEFESRILTDAARAAASAAVPPQYSYASENAITIAAAQQRAFDARVARADATFSAALSPANRRTLLEISIPNLSETAKKTLVGLDVARWAAVRTEAARILDATLRTELRDTEVENTRTRLSSLMAGGLDESERMLAAELISPLLVPNSSFSDQLTNTARAKAAEGVTPTRVTIRQGEVIVRNGSPLAATDIEKIDALGMRETVVDVASFAGWVLLALLLVGTLLAWIWRFRPALWHRDNVLVLIGLLVVGATLALKITAGRPTLPFFLPTAAIAMLLAILLDAPIATMVIAIIAVIGGAVNNNSLELATYIFLGGMAGVVTVRRGDRLQVFVQAALAVFVASALVVSVFSLLGTRDLRGVLELWFGAGASAAGSGIAAVGTFAVLGSVFGILTVFQLLELANPSQPLLRRLLVETPGTYHHSLMVGNLAERAAEAIGADPLVTRVAAYYHDVGKLANPLAFIENQAGGENIHDQLDPEVSAQILKQHVVDGIDLAYKSRLPKALIAFIPQHHGTAIMSYFYARAKELAGPGVVVDERKFRHAGPKPQSREAALLMLADGVEASVRSLASRDEAAIRAMVSRIIEERIADGQFDECDLTLRDLERIREAFVGQLLGMYHTRIAYPQNTVVELESRRAGAAGGGSSGTGRGGSGPAS
ncbi:MAG: cyclic-di-AMP phosphodiesterase PgpH [Chloroflexota bacterium]|nr:cyclic-di-AMP phosphodiesterase PgpH [Chloroflexota bacterium]MEA2654371.1 cyclic-di-AMP phosphodiesterase PgpH [Chloroflexota bacterium]